MDWQLSLPTDIFSVFFRMRFPEKCRKYRWSNGGGWTTGRTEFCEEWARKENGNGIKREHDRNGKKGENSPSKREKKERKRGSHWWTGCHRDCMEEAGISRYRWGRCMMIDEVNWWNNNALYESFFSMWRTTSRTGRTMDKEEKGASESSRSNGEEVSMSSKRRIAC